MKSVDDSLFARALRVLARLICRYPNWFIYPQILLFIFSVLFTVGHLKMDMDQDNLVGGDKKDRQVYLKFKQEFAGEDELAVIVESENMDRNREFVERLAAKLKPETNLFSDVFYKTDPMSTLGRKGLLFIPEPDLKLLQQKLHDFRPFIDEFTQATNLDSFFELVNRGFRTAKREENAENDSMINALPALQRIIEQASDSMSRPGRAVSPGIESLLGGGNDAMEQLYITFTHGRIFVLSARPHDSDAIPEAVGRMRELIRQTEMEVPGLNVGLTGEPVLDFDQMQQSQNDSIKASIVSLVICSLIFIYAYREIGRPLKTVCCLIIGLGYTMAFTSLTVGHLNILTITFAPILIGLAIDFGIHFITRYEEEMKNGKTPGDAVERAMVYTGQGIITGAFTTAMAFLAMGLTNFKGIQEMGVISGGGLILCLVPMMTLLPVLLMKGHQHKVEDDHGLIAEKRARIENFWLQRPVMVVAVTLVVCVAAAFEFKNVYFDYNLLNMQSKGLPAVVYGRKMAYSGQSVLYAAVVADSLQEAREIEKKVENLPTVEGVDGSQKGVAIYDLLTKDQTEALKSVKAIQKEVDRLHFAPVDMGRVHLHELSPTLWRTMGYLSLAAETVTNERPKLAQELSSLRTTISDFRVKLLDGDPAIPQRLARYQQALFDDIRETFDAIKNQDASSPLTPHDLPKPLEHRFVGHSGKYMVQIFPKGDIWQHENQRKFIMQLRQALAPKGDEVTGTPIQLYEYETLLKQSYQQAALYALIAIAFMVFLHFRSFTCVILSLLPVAIGTTWTAGIMGYFGIPLNPANIMTLPLVIGIGVTNGIHILNRVAEEHNPGIFSKSTGKAVLVSGLTALTGFGTLTLAKHQGIQSLGLVMSIGIGACMVAGLTFLPAVINILARYGWSVTKERPSSDNARSPLGLEEPR